MNSPWPALPSTHVSATRAAGSETTRASSRRGLAPRALVAAVVLSACLWPGTSRAAGATYTYNDLGRLHQVIDQNGNVATYNYDAVGNIISIERGARAGEKRINSLLQGQQADAHSCIFDRDDCSGLQIRFDAREHALQRRSDLLWPIVLQPNRHNARGRCSAGGQQGGEVEVLRDDDAPLSMRQIQNQRIRRVRGRDLTDALRVISRAAKECDRARRDVLIGEMAHQLRRVRARLLAGQPRGVGGGLTNVFVGQLRVLAHDVLCAHSRGDHAQDDGDGDARTTNRRLPQADGGIDGDSVKCRVSLRQRSALCSRVAEASAVAVRAQAQQVVGVRA